MPRRDRIEVLAIIVQAFSICRAQRRALAPPVLSWGAVGLAALFVIELVKLDHVSRLDTDGYWDLEIALILASGVIMLVVLVPIFVAAHRVTAPSAPGVSGPGWFRYSRRDLRYLRLMAVILAPGTFAAFGVTLGFIYFLPALPDGLLRAVSDNATAIGMLTAILVYLFSGWVFMRFSGTLFGVALDRKMTFRESWLRTAGSNMPLMGVCFSLAIAPSLPYAYVDYAHFFHSPYSVTEIVARLSEAMVSVLVAVPLAAAIALIHRRLSGS